VSKYGASNSYNGSAMIYTIVRNSNPAQCIVLSLNRVKSAASGCVGNNYKADIRGRSSAF